MLPLPRSKSLLLRTCCVVLATTLAWQAHRAAGQTDLRPVPRMQAIQLPLGQVSFQDRGRELTRYYFTPLHRRPFLFPIVGPSGHMLTRIGHPRDPHGHGHHLSFWVSHQNIDGVNFWEDNDHSRIVHDHLERLIDGDDEAALRTHNRWVAKGRGTLLYEQRTIRVRPLDAGEWLLVLDLEFTTHDREVTLGKTPFGFVGVRVAKTMGVRDGGGTIRNSAGAINEAEVFRKPARWVDYSGLSAPETIEGITLMDHPDNANHPSVFHVRDDGWMGACFSYTGPRTLHPDEVLRLRYGLYVHRGAGNAQAIENVWKRFASELPELKIEPR